MRILRIIAQFRLTEFLWTEFLCILAYAFGYQLAIFGISVTLPVLIRTA